MLEPFYTTLNRLYCLHNLCIVVIFVCCLQDCGCGVGGPAREIATLTGAKVTGINISKYELKTAQELTKKMNLEHLCEFKEVRLRLDNRLHCILS